MPIIKIRRSRDRLVTDNENRHTRRDFLYMVSLEEDNLPPVDSKWLPCASAQLKLNHKGKENSMLVDLINRCRTGLIFGDTKSLYIFHRFPLYIEVVQVAASWFGGRVQDSGLGSRSSPEFNTLPVRLLVVPLSKALNAVLLLSTQEQSGYLWGQVCKPWRQVACERLYTPQGVEMDIQMDMECKGPMTREGTCQSLQSRALSLDVDSKQWLYFTFEILPCERQGTIYFT